MRVLGSEKMPTLETVTIKFGSDTRTKGFGTKVAKRFWEWLDTQADLDDQPFFNFDMESNGRNGLLFTYLWNPTLDKQGNYNEAQRAFDLLYSDTGIDFRTWATWGAK